ncbi:DNA polymerase III, epsilon subunit (fragment) [Magnetospirillum molischianum DSM 120]|uniref:DNA-directed DNA polymerase n=2 Tax=Magnetospirillum molischianum TaxID=1083 RepID=H8FRM1_MAGML
MLRATAELGLGRSLFETLSREPVVYMFDRLCGHLNRSARGIPFLAGTVDDRMLFQARMSLIRTGSGPVTGYVVTLVDAAPQLAGLAGRAELLREAAETIEAPLARIAAATSEAPLVQRDCLDASRGVRRLTEGYDRLLSSWWPMADIVSTELLSFVCSRLGDDVAATVIGLPVWLHGDSHSLVLAVEALVRHTADRLEIDAVDLSAGADEESAWVEFSWAGSGVEFADMERWLGQPLTALGGITLRDVLLHHAGAVPELRRTESGGAVRLPVPKAQQRRRPERPALPARPEFHDLALLEQARETGALGSCPLKSLSFVVFDTETTGLQPSQGDRIVSIAGVRIVNGRILSGESFNRVVNPGRPIPVESVRFHGITDAMVRDKPPAEVVLPQFRAYVADSVLVAHNAAFDLKFLRMNEQAMAISFDCPVLDTMILSSFLDGPEAGHSLDIICERYGIVVTDRHTALGDAMVTAAVLLCQIEALEGRGIVTLDQAVKTLDIARILHDRQRVL